MSATKRQKTLTVAVVTMIGSGPELDIMTVPPDRLAPDLIDDLSLSPLASNDTPGRQKSDNLRRLLRH
jgi:hypothetical protein